MTLFIIIRMIALIRLLQPVWAGLLLLTFHRAFVAYPEYVSTGPFDSGRPIDSHGWMLLAELAVVAILNIFSVMMISCHDHRLEFTSFPFREFRDQIGLVIYFLAFIYATIFTLPMLLGIGWLYVKLMLALYILIALPVIIANFAAR